VQALPADWSGDSVIGWTPDESQEGACLDREPVAALAGASFDVLLTACAIGDE
jgi:hypothetical protein